MRGSRVWLSVAAGLALGALTLPLQAEPDNVEAGWPGFRGPRADGSVEGGRNFEKGTVGATIGWKHELGSGYSALAVGNEGVVATFASGDDDVLAAFDPETGEERWRYRIAKTYPGHDGSHDGPISTPCLSGGRVFGLGPWGHLFAVDGETGKPLWATHLVEDHGGKKPHYGFTSSPVLIDGVLVVGLGGEKEKAFAGFDAETGALRWTLGDDTINYQSPIVTTLHGRRQVLAAGKTNLYGIDAGKGEVLWSYKHDGDDGAMGGHTIVPLPTGDNRLFLMNKVESSVMVEVVEDWSVKELWTTRGIKTSYVTPVYHDGSIYGMSNRIFTCIDAATGETQWRSREPGDGFPTIVGGKLIMLTKPGSLHVAEASSEGYQEVARLDLFEEHSWSEVAYANGHLFARSMNHLARIDLVRDKPETAVTEKSPGSTQGKFAEFLKAVQDATDKESVVEEFFAHQKSFPVIEPTGNVHFLYRGKAEDVGIVGDMIGFRREDPMTRISGTDVFYYSTHLEPNAAVTYGYIVDYKNPAGDPLNEQKGRGLFGEVSWFAMPARTTPHYLTEAEASRHGKIETVEWKSALRNDQDRTAQVYLPAGYDSSEEKRYPVLYVFGGDEAMEGGRMKNSLDHLIGETIDPVIAVFVMPAGANPRADMRPPDLYTKMVAEEIVPMIDDKYNTIPRGWARAALGAGGGGGAALLAGLNHPDVFGRVGSQGATVMNASDHEEKIRAAAGSPLVIYLEWGRYHLRSPHEAWDMAQANAELWDLLRSHGFSPSGGEVPEGFGWECWNGHTGSMLSTLFPKAN